MATVEQEVKVEASPEEKAKPAVVKPPREGKIHISLCEGQKPVVTFFGSIVGRDIDNAHRAVSRQYQVYRQSLAKEKK